MCRISGVRSYWTRKRLKRRGENVLVGASRRGGVVSCVRFVEEVAGCGSRSSNVKTVGGVRNCLVWLMRGGAEYLCVGALVKRCWEHCVVAGRGGGGRRVGGR